MNAPRPLSPLRVGPWVLPRFHFASPSHPQRGLGARPYLIALHGFGGSAQDFELLAQRCAADFDVVSMDWLGHGCAAKPAFADPYSLAVTLQCLSALIERTEAEVGVPAAALLGYSMGGRLLLQWLARHAADPAKLPPLILMGASPGLENPIARAQRQREDFALASHIERCTPQQFAELWESKPLIAPQTRIAEPLRSAIAQRRRQNDCKALACALRCLSPGVLPFVVLPARCPAIVALYGSHDSKFAAIAQALQARHPQHVRAVAVAGAHHAVHLELPKAFSLRALL